MSAKYIFVTGGVTSSLGKGIISASLGKLLQARGFSIAIQKFDPYLNIDPGTMNPYEHGECFVTNDGAETDLDLGHYERFLNTPTSQYNNVTMGKIYYNVINKERKGDYLGKTVQVVPHVTDEIKEHFYKLGESGEYHIIITEIGGCVGDIEALPFIEAVRQTKWELSPENVIVVHLSLLPILKATGELKTKPTQHSVKQLLEAGVQPDVLVCRTELPLTPDIRKKLSLFCNVNFKAVVEAIDAETIYDVPLLMLKERLDEIVLEKLGLPASKTPDLNTWKKFLGKLKNPTHEISIALVGKYISFKDAYKSIYEALVHAGAVNECKVKINWILSDTLDVISIGDLLKNVDGILVAPGFGERGIEGKIKAVEYARKNNIPFLGLCLGMQCAVIEFGRNVLGFKDANSSEFDSESTHCVIDLMEEQKNISSKGGTMRLGEYECSITKNSVAEQIYNSLLIKERHRHRYEFNNVFLSEYEKNGMKISGVNPNTNLVEIIEIPTNTFFVGVQFHPELKSTVENPHPLFIKFVEACIHKNE